MAASCPLSEAGGYEFEIYLLLQGLGSDDMASVLKVLKSPSYLLHCFERSCSQVTGIIGLVALWWHASALTRLTNHSWRGWIGLSQAQLAALQCNLESNGKWSDNQLLLWWSAWYWLKCKRSFLFGQGMATGVRIMVSSDVSTPCCCTEGPRPSTTPPKPKCKLFSLAV